MAGLLVCDRCAAALSSDRRPLVRLLVDDHASGCAHMRREICSPACVGTRRERIGHRRIGAVRLRGETVCSTNSGWLLLFAFIRVEGASSAKRFLYCEGDFFTGANNTTRQRTLTPLLPRSDSLLPERFLRCYLFRYSFPSTHLVSPRCTAPLTVANSVVFSILCDKEAFYELLSYSLTVPQPTPL